MLDIFLKVFAGVGFVTIVGLVSLIIAASYDEKRIKKEKEQQRLVKLETQFKNLNADCASLEYKNSCFAVKIKELEEKVPQYNQTINDCEYLKNMLTDQGQILAAQSEYMKKLEKKLNKRKRK